MKETEINRGKQGDDKSDKQFKPNNVSLRVVKTALLLGSILDGIISLNVKRRDKLHKATQVGEDEDAPTFDLVLAGTNLILVIRRKDIGSKQVVLFRICKTYGRFEN